MSRVPPFSRWVGLIKSDCPTSLTRSPSPLPTLARFSNDERGNISIVFGLMLTSMCLMMGAAVDVGRWMQARNQTQSAIDAAVLAGLVEYQAVIGTNPTGAQALAVQAATAVYKYNVAKRPAVTSDTISFVMLNNNTEMTAVGDAKIATPFLALAHVTSLPVLKTDGSELAISKAGIGSNDGTSFEIAMMIDNTGSMCESAATAGTGECATDPTTSKIYAVKQAATALVQTVLASNATASSPTNVSLIPFTESVNLGYTNGVGSTPLAYYARGPIRSTGGNGLTANADTVQGWQGLYYSRNSQSGSDDYGLQWSSATFWASSMCVTERTGVQKYTDASPMLYPVGYLYNEPVTYSNQWNWESNSRYSGYFDTVTSYTSSFNSAGTPNSNSTDWCAAQAPLIPLSHDQNQLTSAIGAMTPGGGTAGHIGTAWAWYTLSPNFNQLWSYSTKAAAQPYANLSIKNSAGKPILRKIAILMTDGDYNFEYNNGVYDCYLGYNCTPTNDTSKNQAAALCSNMKSAGIEVFTIGAMVSSNAQAFLTSCATDSGHYFNATSTNDILNAFSSITQQITHPFLTH